MDIIQYLEAFSDDQESILFDEVSGHVCFTRYGNEIEFDISSVAGMGDIVSLDGRNIPLDIFIQENLLHLDILAKQIQKAYTNRVNSNIFIDFKSEESKNDTITVVNETKKHVIHELYKYNVFTTKIIEIMADAGQGKSYFLEELAKDLAMEYKPGINPNPILIPVDLLGRVIASIPDAIAGTMQNTIKFPFLKHSDFLMCMRRNWIILALDGYDELAARIGIKDSYIKLNDLIQSLKNSGTVILSARTSFYKSYSTGVAIQQYLRPNNGEYVKTSLRLLPWSVDEQRKYLELVYPQRSEEIYDSLYTAFINDLNLLENPFFFTKIIELFSNKTGVLSGMNKMERVKYIIDQYIERETNLKWKTIESIMKQEDHHLILSRIAEEMWKSSNFEVRSEDLIVITQFALQDMKLSEDTKNDVVSKIGIHAALEANGNYYKFRHEQFFWYYMGYALTRLLNSTSERDFDDVLNEKELSDGLIEWFKYGIQCSGRRDFRNQIYRLTHGYDSGKGPIFLINASSIIKMLLTIKGNDDIEIHGITFNDYILIDEDIRNIKYYDCIFNGMSIGNSKVSNILIENAVINKMVVSNSSFLNVSFCLNVINELHIDGEIIYSPNEIEKRLILKGINIVKEDNSKIIRQSLNENIVKVVKKVIRHTNTAYYAVLEDLEEECNKHDLKTVYKAGIDSGVFSLYKKDASGKKTFFTIDCNKNELETGILNTVEDNRINDFWNKIL